jgi:hypothetical protein
MSLNKSAYKSAQIRPFPSQNQCTGTVCEYGGSQTGNQEAFQKGPVKTRDCQAAQDQQNLATQASGQSLAYDFFRFAGAAYVPTVFVGMYAPFGWYRHTHSFAHGQDRSVIPEIEPPRRGGTTASPRRA